MAPHADQAVVSTTLSNGATGHATKTSAVTSFKQTPLRDQVASLFEDNVAAKILRTASEGLDNNVSP